MSKLYLIILLCPMEPCAPSCTSALEICIDWPPLALPLTALYTFSCLRSRSFIHFGDCRPTLFRRSSRVSLVHVICGFTIDTTHSHSAFGHIAVSLLASLPLYMSGLIHPPVSRRNIHIPLPAIRT